MIKIIDNSAYPADLCGPGEPAARAVARLHVRSVLTEAGKLASFLQSALPATFFESEPLMKLNDGYTLTNFVQLPITHSELRSDIRSLANRVAYMRAYTSGNVASNLFDSLELAIAAATPAIDEVSES